MPADFPVPILIVLHMPVGYTELYARKLDEMSALKVTEARQGDEMTSGRVLVAPAGCVMTEGACARTSICGHSTWRIARRWMCCSSQRPRCVAGAHLES